jgi:hypothetical protein
MEYLLNTEYARFELRQEPLGLWDLWVDGMPTITFESPEAAAESVYKQRSGYVVWDQLENPPAPENLDGWEKIES